MAERRVRNVAARAQPPPAIRGYVNGREVVGAAGRAPAVRAGRIPEDRHRSARITRDVFLAPPAEGQAYGCRADLIIVHDELRDVILDRDPLVVVLTRVGTPRAIEVAHDVPP